MWKKTFFFVSKHIAHFPHWHECTPKRQPKNKTKKQPKKIQQPCFDSVEIPVYLSSIMIICLSPQTSLSIYFILYTICLCCRLFRCVCLHTPSFKAEITINSRNSVFSHYLKTFFSLSLKTCWGRGSNDLSPCSEGRKRLGAGSATKEGFL